MRGEIQNIRAKGAELVVVGNGQPWQAAAFREEMALDAPLFVDPALAAYRAAGLKRGASSVLGFSAARAAVRALRGGHRQKGVQGDAWQLGGVFVIRPDGSVPYAYVSRAAGDHAPPAAVLAAL